MGFGRSMANLCGIGGIILFLLMLQLASTEVYSMPEPAPIYQEFVGFVGLIGGVALLLGANVFKGRWGRVILLFIAVGLITPLGIAAASQISATSWGWGSASLQIVGTTCSSSAGSCPDRTNIF